MKERLPSSFVSIHASIPLLLHVFLQLLFLTRVSFAFLSTKVVPTETGSRFQSSAKGQQTLVVSSWSKIAQFDVPSSSFRLIETDNAASSGQNVTRNGQTPYNLVSPREWLEYCEALQIQQTLRDDKSQQNFPDDSSLSNPEEKKLGGAYTVLRCDFLLDEETWRIWGNDYHFHRLKQSFRSLLIQAGLGRGEEADSDDSNAESERFALKSSREAMNLLLEEAKTTILSDLSQVKRGKSSIIIVMLTLLWDLDNTVRIDDGIPIRVRGHAFSTIEASQLHNNKWDSNGGSDIVSCPNPNTPLQAVIGHLPAYALEKLANHKSHTKSGSMPMSLPNRYRNFPRAKLSSWCRQRRLLEDTFKTKDIGDVLLTKPCNDEDDKENYPDEPSFSSEAAVSSTAKPTVELLEGLTSNLFVVYPGKILRTALSKNVLGGYVRHLIIDCAVNCGYKVEFGSISVEDCTLWEEAFVTSSIRLILPLHRISLPNTDVIDKNGDELYRLETLWEQPSNREGKDCCHSTPTASDILYTELVNYAADKHTKAPKK